MHRDDVEVLTARRDALADDVARTKSELDAAERQLFEAKQRARLPVLDNLRIASPCKMGWHNMTGDDRSRYCGQCKKDVFNLTGMTRAEVEALIVAKHGELCVRYFQRHDGTIMLADCDLGAKGRRRLKLMAAGVAALLAGGAVAGAILLGRYADRERLEAIREIQPTSQLGEAIEGGARVSDDDLPTHSPIGSHVDGEIRDVTKGTASR